jgi:hypothetical protein
MFSASTSSLSSGVDDVLAGQAVTHLRGDEAYRAWIEWVTEEIDFGRKLLSSTILVTNPELRGQLRVLKFQKFLKHFCAAI